METWGFGSFGMSIFSGGLVDSPASKTKRRNHKHSLEEQRPGRRPRHGQRAEARNSSGSWLFVNYQAYKKLLQIASLISKSDWGKEGAIKLGIIYIYIYLGQSCCAAVIYLHHIRLQTRMTEQRQRPTKRWWWAYRSGVRTDCWELVASWRHMANTLHWWGCQTSSRPACKVWGNVGHLVRGGWFSSYS